MAPIAAAAVAAVGAFATEFIFYINPHRFGGWPDYVKRPSYWIAVAIGMGIAGVIAFASASDREIEWYVALNIGAAWPLIIQQAAEHAPAPRARNVN